VLLAAVAEAVSALLMPGERVRRHSTVQLLARLLLLVAVLLQAQQQALVWVVRRQVRVQLSVARGDWRALKERRQGRRVAEACPW
jgi:hypothetical protein